MQPLHREVHSKINEEKHHGMTKVHDSLSFSVALFTMQRYMKYKERSMKLSPACNGSYVVLFSFIASLAIIVGNVYLYIAFRTIQDLFSHKTPLRLILLLTLLLL